MNAETIFILVNLLAITGWLLILVAPYSRATKKLMDGMVIPALIAVAYAVLLICVIPTISFEDFSFLGFTELFSDPWVIALGWTHLVTFNLVAAAWMKQDSQKHHIRHRIMVVPYLLTLMLGPAGLLTYLLVSNTKSKRERKI